MLTLVRSGPAATMSSLPPHPHLRSNVATIMLVLDADSGTDRTVIIHSPLPLLLISLPSRLSLIVCHMFCTTTRFSVAAAMTLARALWLARAVTARALVADKWKG